NSHFAREGRTVHAPDRTLWPCCCTSDPWRATPSLCSNLVFGSDREFNVARTVLALTVEFSLVLNVAVRVLLRVAVRFVSALLPTVLVVALRVIAGRLPALWAVERVKLPRALGRADERDTAGRADMSSTSAARTATGMRSAAAYVASATNMRTATAATSAALLRGRGIGRGRQRGRNSNCGDPNPEFRHVILHSPARRVNRKLGNCPIGK